ncbi:MAG TPA: phage terminase large subunit family protein [Blastocatellia bacterium]|nr:phage terminase large subunit family protein [Blastocatellia bacterium]
MTSATTIRAISEAICSAIPASSLTVSAWADTYRYLAPERSARPGRWSTDLVPYARAIMDAASRPDVHEIVFWKSAQVGGTEIINNIIGYFIHIEPSPILYVCETEQKAKAWSQESLAPMIRDTPVLAALVEEARARDSGNTIEGKKYPGGHLAVAWATSAATLSSRPRRIVAFDEIDAFGTTSEGDPISLGEARTKTFSNYLIIKVSTPRDDETSRIKPAYEASYRGRFLLPCLHCGEYQALEWERIRWDDDPLAAYYVCVNGCVIEHDEKQAMLAQGEWRWEGEFSGVIGFHIWEAYSPFVTWGQMAANFLRKKAKIGELKTFVNTSLAQTWQQLDREIEVGELPSRCEEYEAEVPAGVLLLTAGVDVQGDRLEYEIVGWGHDDESWSIRYGVLAGDPAQRDVWQALRDALRRDFTGADGAVFNVAAACIDSGGHHTDEVYKFCRENMGRRWYAVKGANTPGRPLISKPTLQGKPPVKLFTIGTETAKDAFSARLRVSEPGPNYCHFPELCEDGHPVYDESYFKQLCSEQPVIEYRRGVATRVWRKIRPSLRNEALDCRVYAMAALQILNPDFERLAARRGGESAPSGEGSESAAPRRERPARTGFTGHRRGGGFVGGWR